MKKIKNLSEAGFFSLSLKQSQKIAGGEDPQARLYLSVMNSAFDVTQSDLGSIRPTIRIPYV